MMAGSLYVPTPQRKVRNRIKNIEIVPSNVYFMDLIQLDKWIKYAVIVQIP